MGFKGIAKGVEFGRGVEKERGGIKIIRFISLGILLKHQWQICIYKNKHLLVFRRQLVPQYYLLC